MHRVLFILSVFFLLEAQAQDGQVNPKKLDSLTRSIENSRKSLQAWQDSFNKRQDSLYKSARQSIDIQQNTKNLLNLIAENKAREERRRQQNYMRLALVAALLVAFYIAMRRRKKKAGP